MNMYVMYVHSIFRRMLLPFRVLLMDSSNDHKVNWHLELVVASILRT